MLPLFTITSLTEGTINGCRAVAAGRAITLLGLPRRPATGIAVVGNPAAPHPERLRSTTILGLPVALSLLTAGTGAPGNRLFMDGGPRLILPAVTTSVLGTGNKTAAITPWHLPVHLATGIAAVFMSLFAASTCCVVPAGTLMPSVTTYALVPPITSAPTARCRACTGLERPSAPTARTLQGQRPRAPLRGRDARGRAVRDKAKPGSGNDRDRAGRQVHRPRVTGAEAHGQDPHPRMSAADSVDR
ncbi:hypothetical protein [Streptomyces sp. NEAU-H3]|uniref:hypothetical protein n=1 Tax=Streptomyces sp. NEAU-H3 TaxID=2720636 RepID=UPI00143A7605|nr:hypothetical protein [Streptomyces sp. NEAU-H3]NJA59196.1 hypothetical protein [Streptomyces sp. NEAU-H3]